VALARVAVDVGILDGRGEPVIRQHEVDPHAAPAVEHPGAVVPVGERRALERARPQIGETERQQRVERVPLGATDVSGADERRRIPDILIGGATLKS